MRLVRPTFGHAGRVVFCCTVKSANTNTYLVMSFDAMHLGGQLNVRLQMCQLVQSNLVFEHSVLLFAGYFSWRNSNKGSWFVQALTRVLDEFGKDREIMWLLTRVNHITAHEFQSNAARADMNEKKQVSQIVSMLTKELYFRPKSSQV